MPLVDDWPAPPPRGSVEPTTWGAVGVGDIVVREDDFMFTIEAEKTGWLKAVSPRRDVEPWVFRRPVAHEVARVYVPTEEEAVELLGEILGARRLRDIERREHTLARALTWHMEPIAANAKTLRDHLDMIHEVKVDDVLRKYEYSPVGEKPKEKTARRKSALAELQEAHDVVHADPHNWPSHLPHYHAPIEKEVRP